ncbi:MAG: LemA family protein [Deltaproteobacteria bacterium]|jgi:LemA protein|nr:LemA family protein [Deltaproteobacteria bacterium]
MTSVLLFLLVLVVILGIIGGLLALIYNRLVKAKNAFQASFAQIDVQLKRRYDLIPNLVESSRAYLAHESQTLDAVIKARNVAAQARQSASGDPSQAGALKRLSEADSSLSGILSQLMVVVESYPNLKADSTISELMNELTKTEDQISLARSSYNYLVMEYNQAREVFPSVLFAGLFGFLPANLWVLTDPTQAEPVRFTLTPPANP